MAVRPSPPAPPPKKKLSFCVELYLALHPVHDEVHVRHTESYVAAVAGHVRVAKLPVVAMEEQELNTSERPGEGTSQLITALLDYVLGTTNYR